jgi:hypothetical protein
MPKPVYVNGVKVKVLKPYGPRESRVPDMGWLCIWHEGHDIVPDKRIWCDKREVARAVSYWEENRVTGVRKWEFMPENASNALSLILAEEKPVLTALGRILA